MSTIVNNRRTASSTKGRQPAPTRNFLPKKPSLDKPVPTEGVYGDARFTHVVYTLVGTNVQVQVKNGKVYEGIFKTISPQMDVVLEVAHLKMEGNGSSCGPTRDTIIDKVIFKKDDVVSVTSLSVDLDYAVKDTFTDAAISRGNNGNSFDVELQPWDGEAGEEIGGGLEEGESANGWDVNEMFKTNQEQFSVKSSYDENLSQYTTVLNKSDTKEYRKREEDARRLAREIEHSEDYRKHIDLENGDDEEALFSSVHRPSSATNQSGEKKYIPPQRRNNNNMTKGQGNNGVDNGSFQQVQRSNHNNKHRQPGVQHHQHQLSPSPQHHPSPQTHSPQHSHKPNYPPRHQQQQQHHQQQQQPLAHQQQQQVKTTVVHVSCPPGGQQTTQANSNKDEQNNKLNGQENSGSAQDISIAKPTSQSGVSSPTSVPLQQQQQQQESNDNKRIPRQPVNKNTKTAKIVELKQFQDQFKLEDQKESDRKTATVEIDNKPETDNKTVDNSNNKANERLDVQQTEEDSGEQSGKVTPAKFVLNPLAKEFHPEFKTNTSSSPARVHPTQSPTPPRPQAQSPVVVPTYYFLPQQPPVTRPYQQTKKAVVSAYPNQDFRQAAQHATGQPLLAGTIPPQQYLPYMMSSQMIQQGGYTMMNQHPRMMNPAALGPSSTTGIDPSQANSQQLYMSQPGPHAIQAHMTQQALQQSQQQHVAHPAGTPQTPGVQMTQVAGHHPAPSPVQHVQGGQANHPGQVPPTAGTPQPLNYTQINLPGHIHGSHNPTSPQTIHASNPFNSHPQFTFSQGQPTSVSHAMSMQSQMPSQPVPVYMMQPPPSNQVQQHQFQTHMAGGPMPGQGHIMHHGVPGQGQVQYVPHVPSQAQQVLQYPPGQ